MDVEISMTDWERGWIADKACTAAGDGFLKSKKDEYCENRNAAGDNCLAECEFRRGGSYCDDANKALKKAVNM